MFARRILRNLGWKTLGIFIEKALRLVLVALVARALGTQIYGQYTYAVALSLLCVQITDLGLGLFLAREIARHDVPPARLIGHVFTIKAVLALGYLGLMAGLVWWHLFADPDVLAATTFHPRPGALGWTVALTGLAGLAVSSIEAMWQVFRGVQRVDLEARSGSMFAALQLSLVAGMLWLVHHVDPSGRDKGSIMVMVASAMLLASLGALVYTARLLAVVVTPQFGWSRTMLQRFGREVLPLGVAIVASLIYFKIDVPMLRALRGDVEVGVYNAAYRLLENLSVVPSILLVAIFPALSQTVETDPHAAARLHRTALKVLLLAGVAGTIVLLVLPEFIVGLLYGPAYAGSAAVLRALAPSVILTFVNYLETHMLVALGLVRAQMAFAIALIGVNIGANLLLIPRWGGVGAALATAATEVVLLLFCVPMVAKALRERMAEHALRPPQSDGTDDDATEAEEDAAGDSDPEAQVFAPAGKRPAP